MSDNLQTDVGQPAIPLLPASNGSAAPTWYTAEEMRHYLRLQRYSEEIADELSANYAKNLQQAFNKGYQLGAREAKRPNVRTEPPARKL